MNGQILNPKDSFLLISVDIYLVIKLTSIFQQPHGNVIQRSNKTENAVLFSCLRYWSTNYIIDVCMDSFLCNCFSDFIVSFYQDCPDCEICCQVFPETAKLDVLKSRINKRSLLKWFAEFPRYLGLCLRGFYL